MCSILLAHSLIMSTYFDQQYHVYTLTKILQTWSVVSSIALTREVTRWAVDTVLIFWAVVFCFLRVHYSTLVNICMGMIIMEGWEIINFYNTFTCLTSFNSFKTSLTFADVRSFGIRAYLVVSFRAVVSWTIKALVYVCNAISMKAELVR